MRAARSPFSSRQSSQAPRPPANFPTTSLRFSFVGRPWMSGSCSQSGGTGRWASLQNLSAHHNSPLPICQRTKTPAKNTLWEHHYHHRCNLSCIRCAGGTERHKRFDRSQVNASAIILPLSFAMIHVHLAPLSWGRTAWSLNSSFTAALGRSPQR